MPAGNSEAVGQRAIAAARQRSGPRAAPALDPVFVALNPGALPARERSAAELYEWVRRDEQYAILGANVVVELNSESRALQPTTPAWAIIRCHEYEQAARVTSGNDGRGRRPGHWMGSVVWCCREAVRWLLARRRPARRRGRPYYRLVAGR
jgi:hypothetical protein